MSYYRNIILKDNNEQNSILYELLSYFLCNLFFFAYLLSFVSFHSIIQLFLKYSFVFMNFFSFSLNKRSVLRPPFLFCRFFLLLCFVTHILDIIASPYQPFSLYLRTVFLAQYFSLTQLFIVAQLFVYKRIWLLVHLTMYIVRLRYTLGNDTLELVYIVRSVAI